MPIRMTVPKSRDAEATLRLHPVSDLRNEPLEVLYRQHAVWLTGVLRRTLGLFAADAEDLVHDAYVRIGRYAPDDLARHPRALLRKIAVNLARDHMRRTVVRGRSEPIAEEGPAIDPRLSTASTQEADVELKRLMLALPQPLRDVFILSRFTRMRNEEIAAHFAISVKTVEWRLSKALALCARHLED